MNMLYLDIRYAHTLGITKIKKRRISLCRRQFITEATSFNVLVRYLPNSSLLSPPPTRVNTASLGPHEGLPHAS